MQPPSSEFNRAAPAQRGRGFKMLLWALPIFGLTTLNILTLVNDEIHTAGVSLLKAVLAPAVAEATLSRWLSRSPAEKFGALEKSHRALESKHVELKKVAATRAQAVRNVSQRVTRRAIANAGKNVASYAAEIVPAVGVAAITALTLSDLYDDCQTLKDINELNLVFEQETTDESTVCGIKFP